MEGTGKAAVEEAGRGGWRREVAWKHFSQNMGGGLKARLSERQTLQTMRQRSCATAFSSTPECIMMS